MEGSVIDLNATSRANGRLRRIEKTLNRQLKQNSVYFTVGEFPVKITEWQADLDSLTSGSIVIRFSLIGIFTLELYGAIADYPDFKEAVPLLYEDIQKAVSWAVAAEGKGDEPWRIPEPDPSNVELFFKEEDDLISLIEHSN